MTTESLTQLSADELIKEEKKRKGTSTSFKFVIGMMVGVALYSTVKNGFGVLTFLPLFFIPLQLYAQAQLRDIRAEIKTRNL